MQRFFSASRYVNKCIPQSSLALCPSIYLANARRPCSSGGAVVLNPLSNHIRSILKEHRRAARSEHTEKRAAIETQLLHVLANAKTTVSITDSSALLHPLLCVRILERLGYAVYKDPDPAEYTWLQSAYSAQLKDPVTLAAISAQVLLPLAALLTGEGHPHVLPVAFTAAEWWATLPASPSTPARVWLPVLMQHYGNTPVPQGVPSATFLFPFIAHRIMTEVPAVEQQEQLVAWLQLCLRQSATQAVEGTSGSDPEASRNQSAHSVVVDAPELVEALFWWGTGGAIISEPAVGRAVAAALSTGGVGAEKHPQMVVARVAIENDDAFRRFLLRVAAGSAEAVKRGIDTPTSADTNVPRILLEPVVAIDASLSDQDPDNILRWIHPLLQFLEASYGDTSAEQPSRCCGAPSLSFVGVVKVLSAVLDRLQALRFKSCGNHQATGAEDKKADLQHFTLMPHKPRIHAVKRACEMLLHHARQQLPPSSDASTLTLTPSLWFPDVSVQQQEPILRRMCGTARALVRVVMEEKRLSLLVEGPEGTALSAGGLQQQREDSAASPIAVVSDALRNTAHRVVEPALRRYYDLVCEAHGAGPCTLPLDELQKVIQRGSEGQQWPGLSAQPQDHEYWALLYGAMAQVHRDVGGSAGLQTAAHILRHPLHQPLAAVLESIRLVAVHALLLNDSSVLADGGGLAEPVVQAFFSAWSRLHDEGGNVPLNMAAPLQSRLLILVMLSTIQSGASRALPQSTLTSLLMILTADGQQTEWARVLPQLDDCANWVVPSGIPAGLSSHWELVEELRVLGCGSRSGRHTIQWYWLGSAAEVLAAAQRLEEAEDEGQQLKSPLLFLIPWSALAHSRQPLRLYDESGHSAAAADQFDLQLQRLQQACARGAAVVRLVSISEEMNLFRDLCHTPECVLDDGGGDDGQLCVVNEAARLELQLRATSNSNSTNSVEDDWEDGSSYDGLD